ncbi:UTP--glucose-1-phosphate uridylyltransferase GalU [Fictibacillus sp. KIGAM418]|uniref:UTP--glucose-1-phosphate uridylyltransferase n=1 Tax=Fictibacillus marinisediminis TaxID=2878389 RepID=A0A9X2BF94_9BACL|nr:UTP--glucose-1-phosphate uridylyltransferase GalU [Fictibacillus marinisediminis]MCK6259496.1 UTP--glucose-1-phosphate uridylyltransferase GalU [Fictibacillus marinisediminis]
MKVRKAIIPIAGLGTRFLPATKAQPKAMFPIVDKPAIQYVVEEAVASGIEEIFIIINPSDRAIQNHFNRSYELEEILELRNKIELRNAVKKLSSLAKIKFLIQKHPKGLGDAISCARPFIKEDEPFAVLLGDDIVRSQIPCLTQLIQVYESHRSPVIGVLPVKDKDISKYGIIHPKNDNKGRIIPIKTLVEKPALHHAPSRYAIIGRYILLPQIFALIEKTPPDKKNQEIQLTDALIQLNKVQSILAYKFQGKRYDVGDRIGFLEANIDFALQREDLNERLTALLRNKSL